MRSRFRETALGISTQPESLSLAVRTATPGSLAVRLSSILMAVRRPMAAVLFPEKTRRRLIVRQLMRRATLPKTLLLLTWRSVARSSFPTRSASPSLYRFMSILTALAKLMRNVLSALCARRWICHPLASAERLTLIGRFTQEPPHTAILDARPTMKAAFRGNEPISLKR